MIHLSILSQIVIAMLVLSAAIVTLLFRDRLGIKGTKLLLWSNILFFIKAFGTAIYLYFKSAVAKFGVLTCISLSMLLELFAGAGLILISLFFIRQLKVSGKKLHLLVISVISAGYFLIVFATIFILNPILVMIPRGLMVALGVYVIYKAVSRGRGVQISERWRLYLLLMLAFRYLIEFSIFLSLLMRQQIQIFQITDILLEAAYLVTVILYLNQMSKRWLERAAEAASELVCGEAVLKFNISKREKEVVELIIAGKSNKEIAEELFISLSTVKDHIHRVFKKTGVNNRMLLANILRKQGD